MLLSKKEYFWIINIFVQSLNDFNRLKFTFDCFDERSFYKLFLVQKNCIINWLLSFSSSLKDDWAIKLISLKQKPCSSKSPKESSLNSREQLIKASGFPIKTLLSAKLRHFYLSIRFLSVARLSFKNLWD